MIVSFTGYTPPGRYDDEPWTQVKIEEAAASTGSWATIDTQNISPLDADPSRPAPHNFTTSHATGANKWYRLTYLDAAANTSLPTIPVQNTVITAYATTADLFRVLKVRTATGDQTAAAQGDLDTATIEINEEIDFVAGQVLSPAQQELCKGVCIDRAADLWRHRESAPGILGIPDETLPATFGRYSWERYAQRLAPLKQMWGIA